MMLRATELVNFAQGELVMSGAFIGYTLLVATPLPYLAVFIVASILTGILGMLVERVALRPIRLRQSPLLNLLIATIGIGICLRLVSQLIWGAAPLRYPVSVGQVGHLVVAGLPMSIQHIWIIALAILSMLALHYFFERTLPGIAWRASAYDSYTAEIMGVSFDRVVTMTFGISSMLAGAAGVLIAPLFFVAQELWLQGPRAFAGAALGQFHILGTMIGGPILGLLETFAAGYISSAYKNGIAFGITIIVLMLVAIPRMPRGGSLVFRYGRQSIAELFELNDRQAAHLRYGTLAALGIVVFALPLLLDTYETYLVTLILIYATGALGLQLVIGYAGAIIVGHAAFLGIGAYTSAILTVYFGVPFLLAIIAAAIVAAVFGLLFGPILRLPTHFCAIATLGFGEIMHLVFINWKKVTNGMSGISGIRKPSIGAYVFEEGAPFYFLTIAVLAVVYAALQRLIRSRYGRGLIAARENELASISMGVKRRLVPDALLLYRRWLRRDCRFAVRPLLLLYQSGFLHDPAVDRIPYDGRDWRSRQLRRRRYRGVLRPWHPGIAARARGVSNPDLRAASYHVHGVLAWGTGGPRPPVAVCFQTGGRNPRTLGRWPGNKRNPGRQSGERQCQSLRWMI